MDSTTAHFLHNSKTSFIKTHALLFILFVQLTGKVMAQHKSDIVNLVKNSSLKGWKILGGRGLFAIKNGVITGTSVVDSVNTFLVTEKEYGDFILELDVKIESPLSNSGIQTRSHFGGDQHREKVYGRQMEIDPSSRKWTGGIYDEERREWLYPLTLNVAAKDAFIVGKYNHVKIECIGNEMKTWINQVPVAYLKDTIDRSGFIGLQVHAAGDVEKPGTKVYFKNIRIKTKNLLPQKMPEDVYIVDTNRSVKQ